MTAMPHRDARRDDIVAGLTVALVGLPQCLAYAMMSGLPPAYGLVTAAVPGLVAALAGKSAHVVTGPTNTTGLLILAAVGPWLGETGLVTTHEGLAVVASLALLAGLVRVVGSWIGAAELLRFLPESVLIGFTAGAGILIAVNQLDEALGLAPLRGGGLFTELGGLARALANGEAPALGAVMVTAGTVALLLFGRRRLRGWPLALIAVAGVMLVAWALGLDRAHGLPVVGDRAPVPRGWPAVALPDLRPSVLYQLALPAAAIALLGTLELAVSVRAGEGRPDMRREIRAQGLANLAGAMTGGFPASASLTRSALLRLGNVRTRLAAIVAAVVVVPVLLFAGPAVARIAQASLAGVLLVTALGMLERRRIARLYRTSTETRVLMIGTLVATLLLPLEHAILLGAGVALVIHLAHTSVPRLRLLVPRGDRLGALEASEKPRSVVLEVSGNLHYAAVPPFVSKARALIPSSAELVVIDLSHAHDLRFAAIAAFEELASDLEPRGVDLRLAGVDRDFCAALARARSRLCVTAAAPEPGESVRQCLAGRAEQPDRVAAAP